MLRTHRELRFSLAVSAGQELVTTASDYLQYAVGLEETRVIGMFLETMRDADGMRAGLAAAAERDIPVVALTVGESATGREMVTAHSGALAGGDGAWEALFERYGVHRASDLDELTDTIEMFAIGRRIPRGADRPAIATVHDSGGERALIADAAEAVGVDFAPLTDTSRSRLTEILAEGLAPTNPLDVWGTGSGTEDLITTSLRVLAEDETVDAVALAVDLVYEYDDDFGYPNAVERVNAETTKPVIVLSNMSNAIDQAQARGLRALGVPVLEGTYSGLRALRHLVDHATERLPSAEAKVNEERRATWRAVLGAGDLSPSQSADLLADYGIDVARTLAASSLEEAVKAAADVGYPVVLKTAVPGIEHKADVDGVKLDLKGPDDVATSYADLAARLGPEVTVQPQLSGDVELALGIVNDPILGPLVLLAVGGVLVEVIQQRRVSLPPLSTDHAEAMIGRLPVVETLLAGVRGRPAVNRDAVVGALVGLSELAVELGDLLAAVDVNPLLCSAQRAVAVDALVQRR
jgi:acyl-CoA synthetase (NDP forming)